MAIRIAQHTLNKLRLDFQSLSRISHRPRAAKKSEPRR